jgi:hypothetical protein
MLAGCTRPVKGRGYCELHYRRWRKHGDPTVVLQRNYLPLGETRLCEVEGCTSKHAARGFCGMHYQRFLAEGSPGELQSRQGYGWTNEDG